MIINQSNSKLKTQKSISNPNQYSIFKSISKSKSISLLLFTIYFILSTFYLTYQIILSINHSIKQSINRSVALLISYFIYHIYQISNSKYQIIKLSKAVNSFQTLYYSFNSIQFKLGLSKSNQIKSNQTI